MAMPEGIVKWFDSWKRYGFIEQDGCADVFFFASSIVGDERLYGGERVTFQVEEDDRGLKAVNVRKLRE
jgi:CspA family cold shock protein